MSGHDLAMAERLEATAVKVAHDIIAGGSVPAWQLSFRLARRLRGIPGADGAIESDPGVIRDAIRAFCDILHANPSDLRDLDFSPAAYETVYVEVLDKWDKVRLPGNNALEAAYDRAEREPIVLRAPLNLYGVKFQRIVSTARWLQWFRQHDTIILPVRLLGILAGMHHTRVAAYLRVATKAGLLVVVEEPVLRGGRRLARTYRFNVESPKYEEPHHARTGVLRSTDPCLVPIREPGEDDEDPSPATDVDALGRATGRP